MGQEEKNLPAEMEKLQLKLLETEKQAQENLAGWQRAQADYANFKRETDQRQKDLFEFANAAFMTEFLPIYSHFKLALEHMPEGQRKIDWVIGIRHIKKQFQDWLKKYKIEEIKTIGELFNHNWHEAVTHEEQAGYKSETIFAEVQPGYTLNGKVLMPAKVKVAK